MCRYFETLSFLPPLTEPQIAKQVDYIVGNSWVPCLEFQEADGAYVANINNTRFHDNGSCGYYDNRYWTMWKLPMFGCNDASAPSALLHSLPACSPACCHLHLAAAHSSLACSLARPCTCEWQAWQPALAFGARAWPARASLLHSCQPLHTLPQQAS